MADRPDIAGDLIYVFDHAPLPFLAELAREMEIPISFDNLIVSEQEIDNNTSVLVDAIIDARSVGRVLHAVIENTPLMDKYLSNNLRASLADHRKTLSGMFFV